MPSVIRLNRKGLLDWIESIEAGGGDATALRRELEALGPVQGSRTRTHRQDSRFNNEEEPTIEERLNNRGWGDLFPNGIPLQEIFDYDYRFTKNELIEQCRKAGLGVSGDKAELATKLIAHNKGGYCNGGICRPEQV